MRLPLRLVLFLVTATLVAASCSSSTVVASEGRDTADEAEATADEEGSEPLETRERDAGADGDDDEATEDEATVDEAEEPASARDLQESAGFGLGGTEQLDSLVEDCIADNDMACDVLFLDSDFDSDEETTALTCGGRSDVEVIFCTEGIDAVPAELVFDEDSEGLPAIITACREGGDMTACDFLYSRSPIDSDAEALGATCGGRVELAIPDCRTFLSET